MRWRRQPLGLRGWLGLPCSRSLCTWGTSSSSTCAQVRVASAPRRHFSLPQIRSPHPSCCCFFPCADKPGSSPDPSGEVNTNVAFCSVLRSRLGSHPLLFSGEVDCTDPHAPSTQPPSCYVELKTSKEMHSPGQWRGFYRFRAGAGGRVPGLTPGQGTGVREGRMESRRGVPLTPCISCQTQAPEMVGSVVPPRSPKCCCWLP